MLVPKDKSKRRRRERLKEKQCQFPIPGGDICGIIFYGTARSLYCPMHRHRKFRKFIDKPKDKKEDIGVENQIINHKLLDEQKVILKCSLEGCEEEFKVTLIPKQNIYPKYCEKHRNAYQRERFIQQNQMQFKSLSKQREEDMLNSNTNNTEEDQTQS